MVATIREPEKQTPVFGKCNVLVVGGGPAGSAAAASAARMGADTILLERYGHLGGMSTGGFVLWIDSLTDWSGEQIIAGFANEVLDRMPREALLGPPDELWGSTDPHLVEYWQDRSCAFNGTVTFSPTVDAEALKTASQELLLDHGVKLLFHSWAVSTVQKGNTVQGVIFESKSGRQAILADVVIDATGDGDIFAMAGAPFEADVVRSSKSIQHKINVSYLWAGADMDRYRRFRIEQPKEYRTLMQEATKLAGGMADHRPSPMPRNDVALFMGPRLTGYSCIDVEDLTTVEIESRRIMTKMIAFYTANVPGFENAWVMAMAPQIGTRHSRRLIGVKQMNREDWTSGKVYDDEIAITPPPNPKHPNLSIPLGCLIPPSVDNLLVAGRNFSCDPMTHSFMRFIAQCWQMGQAAGIAASLSSSSGVPVRDIGADKVRSESIGQGVVLRREKGPVLAN